MSFAFRGGGSLFWGCGCGRRVRCGIGWLHVVLRGGGGVVDDSDFISVGEVIYFSAFFWS